MTITTATPVFQRDGRKRPATGLLRTLGGRFSVAMGIDLQSLDARELFKWFIAAVLFGAPISQPIATRTYFEFARENLLSPKALLRRGWDGLVEVLDRGGYVRYDFKTATKLLDLSKTLLDRYKGDLNQLHDNAVDPRDLEQKLKALGKGIGEVTVGIFLRELRGLWPKAQPRLSEIVLTAARELRFVPSGAVQRDDALRRLQKLWIGEGNRMNDFPDFEAALVRHALARRRTGGQRSHDASSPRKGVSRVSRPQSQQ